MTKLALIATTILSAFWVADSAMHIVAEEIAAPAEYEAGR